MSWRFSEYAELTLNRIVESGAARDAGSAEPAGGAARLGALAEYFRSYPRLGIKERRRLVESCQRELQALSGDDWEQARVQEKRPAAGVGSARAWRPSPAARSGVRDGASGLPAAAATSLGAPAPGAGHGGQNARAADPEPSGGSDGADSGLAPAARARMSEAARAALAKLDFEERVFLERLARRQSLAAGRDVTGDWPGKSSGMDVSATGDGPLTPEEEEERKRLFGNRQVSGQTVRHHLLFERASQDYHLAQLRSGEVSLEGEQGSEAWFKLRDARLTASAFANALGFWASPGRKAGRVELWEEKLGLAPRFTGNAATRWGSTMEPLALEQYAQLTGRSVGREMFRFLGTDHAHSWVGGSPDGLVPRGGAESVQGATGASEVLGVVSSRLVAGGGDGAPQPGTATLPGAWEDQLGRLTELQGGREGILEVKCPWFSGQPLSGKPWVAPPHYYMPQVQGLLYIYDRPWCHLFCWSYNGCTVYHVDRNETFWAEAWPVLAEFWWQYVVPARLCLSQGTPVDLRKFEPPAEHPKTPALIRAAQDLASSSPSFTFAADSAVQAKARAMYEKLAVDKLALESS